MVKRAFVKTIYVGINSKDFYPEWPVQLRLPRKKLIMNVWRNCPKVTNKLKSVMCSHDIEIHSFDLTPIIKDPEEIDRVKELIRSNYDMFLINHIELLVMSLIKFPKLEYSNVLFYHE